MRGSASGEAAPGISEIGTSTVSEQKSLVSQGPDSEIGFLHEIGSRIAAADSLQTVLNRVVHFVSSVVQCDSCFVYVLADDELILRASKNPHSDVVDRLKLRVGQGITGWVAEHRQPVAVGCHAFEDPRFQVFNELPEDHYEAFLSVPVLCRGRLVAVINLQHRHPHEHTWAEIQLIATVGFLVGAEIELARLESENSQLSERLETRKVLDRAKGILQRDLSISEEEAYLMIQRQSRQRRRSKREIAEAILLADDLRRGRNTT
jgi:uroporphyrinogen-III synthase